MITASIMKELNDKKAARSTNAATKLTILTEKKLVFLNSSQESIERKA